VARFITSPPSQPDRLDGAVRGALGLGTDPGPFTVTWGSTLEKTRRSWTWGCSFFEA